ncbi:hypothetical protein ACW6QP_01205 [Salegentibacter sp. HM20]
MSDIDDYLLIESTNEYLELDDSDYLIEEDESFFFTRYHIHGSYINENLSNDLTDLILDFSNKETFYIKAIKNLIKQKEYINLMYQLSNDLISNEEFSEELDRNESKYLIKIDQELNINNYKAIVGILNKLKEDFTEDDVSEVFSLKTRFTNRVLKNKFELD